MFSACFLAFCTGFLSLSLEILWVRLFAFTNHSMPQAFAFVLAVYLIGIALGAHIGKWFCKKSYNLWMISGIALVVSSACDLAGPWIYANWALSDHQLVVAGLVILLTSLLKAIPFPIAHHLGTPLQTVSVSRNISYVYVSNIIGATIGPLFTGILLLAWISTQQGFVVCSWLTFLVATYCLYLSLRVKLWKISAVEVLAAVFFIFILMQPAHQLILKIATPIYGDIIHISENQYGIVTIYAGGKEGDVVAGGNTYDGRTNVDPVINSNRINRVIVLSGLVDKPRRVLMIGLSIGSWLKVVTSFPDVEAIDVVEINPGYLDLIRNYPVQESAILDPRVNIHIDDGRRWLNAHPENKYDIIVMNTTYHWRAYITNLLSQQFLQILKQHMNDKAVLAYNTTGSPDVLKTARSVFKHAYLYENFVIASNVDWRVELQSDKAFKRLKSLTLDGKPLYPPGSDQLIAGYLQLPVSSLESLEPIYNGMGRYLEIITDRNMITEFKYGKTLQ